MHVHYLFRALYKSAIIKSDSSYYPHTHFTESKFGIKKCKLNEKKNAICKAFILIQVMKFIYFLKLKIGTCLVLNLLNICHFLSTYHVVYSIVDSFNNLLFPFWFFFGFIMNIINVHGSKKLGRPQPFEE